MLSLIVDGGVPTPDADAGSAAILDLARGLKRFGHTVCFYPDGRTHADESGDLAVLRDFEIPGTPFAGPAGLIPWLDTNGGSIDYAFFSRPGPAAKYLPLFADIERVRRLYFGHDIHYRRMRMGQAAGIVHAPLQLQAMEALERRLWRSSDLVIYPSEEECAEVRAREPAAAAAMPIYALEAAAGEPSEPHPRRCGSLFVGGPLHAPNRDAVTWFAASVLPAVRSELPDFVLRVVGDWPEIIRAPLEREGLVFLGKLSHAALADATRLARMSVAPLRFGGGVKRKVVAALADGLPVVTTPVGLQGLAGPGCTTELALVAESAEAFVAAVRRLAADDRLWRRLAGQGRDFVRARYSEAAYDAGLRGVLHAASRVRRVS